MSQNFWDSREEKTEIVIIFAVVMIDTFMTFPCLPRIGAYQNRAYSKSFHHDKRIYFVPAEALQDEVYIKLITLASSPFPAADLEVLHDGQKYYQSGSLFPSDFEDVYQRDGYTLRLSVATAYITSVRIYGVVDYSYGTNVL